MIYAEERYNNIMRLLTEKGRISSAELSSALNISRETIRRDLNRLAQEGRLVKTRGGAILPDASLTSLDFPYTAREKANRTEKIGLMRLCRQIYSGEGYHFSGQQFYCYAFDTLHPQAVSAEPSGLLHSSAADALEHAQS